MNFEGYSPFDVDRWGSLVEFPDPTTLPLGLGRIVRNMRFKPTSVKTRFGVLQALKVPNGKYPITGVGSIVVGGDPPLYVPFAFDLGGTLYKEFPAASGALKPIKPTIAAFAPPAGAYLRFALAYNKAYLMFSDLLSRGLGPGPMVLNGQTGALDPLSDHLMGETWLANTAYLVGNFVSVSGVAKLFRCIQAGTSDGAQPAFATTTGATYNDGTVIWQEATPSAASTGNAGNICSGTRFMVVLFQNNNGYITGMDDGGPVQITVGSSGFTLLASNLPIGPANTARRILCFTQAGSLTPPNQTISSAGPYFYIPKKDTVGGISQTKTIIEDNVTTQLEVNFTDDFLAGCPNVTQFFRKMRIPAGVDVYYAESLDRMIYQVPALYPSGFLISLPNDPETVYSDTGLVQVAENDGQRAITWREFRGTQYALKESSGHVVAIHTNDPGTWETTKRWEGSGPCGPLAIDNAGNSDDQTSDCLVYAHESGPYIFQGDKPVMVGDEILGLWQQINWRMKHLIWCAADAINFEVHFGVPFRDSTVCDKLLTVNYLKGWGPPFRMSHYTGQLIALIESRKWSFNDIPANFGIRIARDLSSITLPQPVEQKEFDARIYKSQFVFASSEPLGVVNMVYPGSYDDNGQGIDAEYGTAFAPQSGGQMPVPAGAIWDCGGFSVNAVGNAQLYIQLFADRVKKGFDLNPALFDLTQENSDLGAGIFGLTGNRFAAVLSNKKQPGSWFELAKASFHIRRLFSGPMSGKFRAP